MKENTHWHRNRFISTCVICLSARISLLTRPVRYVPPPPKRLKEIYARTSTVISVYLIHTSGLRQLSAFRVPCASKYPAQPEPHDLVINAFSQAILHPVFRASLCRVPRNLTPLGPAHGQNCEGMHGTPTCETRRTRPPLTSKPYSYAFHRSLCVVT